VGAVLRRWLDVRIHLGRFAAVAARLGLVVWTLYQQTNAEFIMNSRA
jgi:hypothetical protein